MKLEAVFNPSHYGGPDDPYETIKVLEAWLTPDEMIGFCKGNAIKYQSRHREKGGTEDLAKASWYQQYLVHYLDARSLEARGAVSQSAVVEQPTHSQAPAAPQPPAGSPLVPVANADLDSGITKITQRFGTNARGVS